MDIKSKLVFLAILCVAAALRLRGFDWGLPTQTLSLTSYHPDEAMVFQSFQHMLGHAFHPGPGLFYGGLYFHFAAAAVKIASWLNLATLGDRAFFETHLPETARLYLVVRSFSLTSNLISIGLSFYAGRLFGGLRLGLLAAGVMACAPLEISISHYTKPDALMGMGVWAVFAATLYFLKSPTRLRAFLSGACAGLSAAVKYNAGVAILLPLFALAKQPRPARWILGLLVVAGAGAGFAIGAPFAWIDFQGFLKLFLGNMEAARTLMYSEVGHPHGAWRFFWVFGAFGFGWPMLIVSMVGAGAMMIRRKSHEGLVLVAAGAIYFVISRSGTRLTPYLLPVAPFVVLFAAVGVGTLWKHHLWTRVVAACLIVSQAAYALAFANLYRRPDPRELAGQWIEQNIPPMTAVGILRSYWWTPGVLRQKNSPYKVVAPCDDQTSVNDCVLAVERLGSVPWLVTSEAEVREFLWRDPPVYPLHDAALRRFLRRYSPAAHFDRRPEILGASLWRRWPPFDFLYIAPSVTVWKRETKRATRTTPSLLKPPT